MRMMVWALAGLATLLVAGCGKGEPEATQADFAKKPMPAGYHGPEGAPPAATPPTGK